MSTRENRIRSQAGRRPEDGGRMEEHFEPVAGDIPLRVVESPVVRQDSRSIAELLKGLSVESATLVRQEVELAKTEMREKLQVFQKSAITMAAGGALLLAALFVAVWAVNQVLMVILAQFMSLAIAVWLAPLLLAVALGAIGWSLFNKGKERMAEEGVKPEQTAATLREDKRWAERKAHEVKEEIRDGR